MTSGTAIGGRAPAAWLVEMVRPTPARVPVGHTIRAGFAVGLPFIVGSLIDQTLNGMWVGLATLLLAAGEREGTYRLNFQIIAVSTPIAAAGYLLGFAQGLPLGALILLTGMLAFLAGAMAGAGAGLLGGRGAVPARGRHRDRRARGELVAAAGAVLRRRCLLRGPAGGGDGDQPAPSGTDRAGRSAAVTGRPGWGAHRRPVRGQRAHRRGPAGRHHREPEGGGPALGDQRSPVGIVLVFGYLIWPHTRRGWIAETFAGAMDRIADQLRLAAAPIPVDRVAAQTRHDELVAARRGSYRSLSDLQVRLKRALSEPGEAGRVAVSWIPAATGAARLADTVTAYAVGRRAGTVIADPAAGTALASRIEELGGSPGRPRPAGRPAIAAAAVGASAPDLAAVAREVTRLSDLVETARPTTWP